VSSLRLFVFFVSFGVASSLAAGCVRAASSTHIGVCGPSSSTAAPVRAGTGSMEHGR
jgi:hypothetical protein